MDEGLQIEAGRANEAFGELVVRVLQRSGVAHFVVSPGSRSTPLAVAASRLASVTVIPDERSATFYALGRVKASGAPVAFICTSGSAAAHAFPAVIEASESGLPLIILSADRPPELQHCHAGQTIDQLKLFGGYARFFAQLPVPQADLRLARQVREILRRAVEAAFGAPAGPVQVNCPFREPFFSNSPWSLPESLWEGLGPVQRSPRGGRTLAKLPERTVLLAGPRAGREEPEEWAALVAFLQRTGVPVLADGCNPLRHARVDGLTLISHYDRLARCDDLWDGLAPEAALVWGEPPTSKVLRERLHALDLPLYQIGSGKRGMNPFQGRMVDMGVSLADTVNELQVEPGAYGRAWANRDVAMEAALQVCLAENAVFFEGTVHRVLSDAIGPGSPVVFANSLAIRDAEWFVPAGKTGWAPYCQRGANGIDGTLSLARGVVEVSGIPGVLVIGDLAFLHDSNGLLHAARSEVGLLIVLINNNGGGIFELLPAAREVADFEALYATPQTVDFANLARAHGVRYQRAVDESSLKEALNGWTGSGLTLLEVMVDRKASAEQHRACLSQLADKAKNHLKILEKK
jgi:2-succinyl-5-enolpyruvyl-6-hydroxy-3-cyclohexene-1-carboxylate synthase